MLCSYLIISSATVWTITTTRRRKHERLKACMTKSTAAINRRYGTWTTLKQYTRFLPRWKRRWIRRKQGSCQNLCQNFLKKTNFFGHGLKFFTKFRNGFFQKDSVFTGFMGKKRGFQDVILKSSLAKNHNFYKILSGGTSDLRWKLSIP